MNPEIGIPIDHKTEHCLVFKSGSSIRSCNRVCSLTMPTDSEIKEIKSYFEKLPFTWAVDSADIENCALLEQNNLRTIGLFPAMTLDLSKIEEIDYGSEVAVKEITKDNNEHLKWIEIVSTSFNVLPAELAKVLDFFLSNSTSNTVRLYLAYYNGHPAAASMILKHGKILSMHWIATIPEFRNKGLGFAVTHKPLVELKANGAEQAILLASLMGKPIYERIGFKQYAVYNMYAN